MISLPHLAPQIPYALSPQPLSSTFSQSRQSGHQNPNTNPSPSHQSQHPQINQNQRTLLSILRADENTILLRKTNIQRFGAGWLRPVGVGKTLQGLDDERTEREEAEASGRDFAPASTHSLPSTTPNTPLERDLDDQVPDADEADVGWIDEEGEDDLEGDRGLDEDLNIDDDDIAMEGEGEAGYGHGGDMARDLDAIVAEAEAEYEHTDTEVEDESSFEMEVERPGVLDRSVWGGVNDQMHVGEQATERASEARIRRSLGRDS